MLRRYLSSAYAPSAFSASLRSGECSDNGGGASVDDTRNASLAVVAAASE